MTPLDEPLMLVHTNASFHQVLSTTAMTRPNNDILINKVFKVFKNGKFFTIAATA